MTPIQFYETGEFWLALVAIVIGAGATVTVAVMNINANKQRDADNQKWQTQQQQARRHWESEQNEARQDHETNLLITQLDREKGAGKHHDMYGWMHAVKVRADRSYATMNNLLTHAYLGDTDYTDWTATLNQIVEESVTASREMRQGLDNYIDESLARVAWGEEMRDTVKALRVSYTHLHAEIARAGQIAEADLNREHVDYNQGYADERMVLEITEEMNIKHQEVVTTLNQLTENIQAS